jgi:hypothetical protein
LEYAVEVDLLEAFEELPHELRSPLLKFAKGIQKMIGETVRREDLNALTGVVKELAEAQRASEARLSRIESVVGELAEAQKRTEARVAELVEAEKRIEKRVEELTEAQRRTEEALYKLVAAHAETRRRLENMSDAVGYSLENRSYVALPFLLRQDFGIEVEGRLVRKYLRAQDKDRYLQVNIYGWARHNGKRKLIFGEAKTSLSKNEVNRFLRKLRVVSELERVEIDEVISVAVVHDVTPEVEEYARERNVKVYWSYELEFVRGVA